MRLIFGTVVLAFAAGGCSAETAHPSQVDHGIADGGTNGGPTCSPPVVGSSPFRRLTRTEYDNTVRDLLGDTTNPSHELPPDEIALGFDNNALARGVTAGLAEHYMLAAEGIAARAVGNLSAILPCNPAGGEALCADSFIRNFASRAYRRPLEPDEISALQATFDAGRGTGSFATGVTFVIERVLQSPSFLYRVELGAPGATPGTPVALTTWELASRLSYLLWETMPDAALFEAALQGHLGSKADVSSQARRMLADPKARATLSHFSFQWLDLGKLDWVVKDSARYPLYAPDFPALFQQETVKFVDDVIWNGPGDLSTLLTAPYSFANARTAPLYGIDAVSGDELVRVELDPTERAGILTQLGFLTYAAKANQTSPVRRGLFVRASLLCDPPSPPPPNANVMVPEPQPGQSGRARFAAHTTNSICAGCHSHMDPIGFGFENYDAVGMWRDSDGEQPVDASGEVVDSPIGRFYGAVDLAHKLAASTDVRQCLAKQYFRFASGRAEAAADTCTLAALDGTLASTGGNVQALLLAMTQADAFYYRAPVSP